MARRAKKPIGITRLPLFLLIWGLASLAMWVPAIHALVLNDHPTSQSFFYAGVLGLMCVTLVGLSMGNKVPQYGMPGQLLSLLGTFVVLPVFLAMPVTDALGNTKYLNAYFDMVSSVTTTGAAIFGDGDRVPPSLHLWRGLVAWMGGLLMLISASAVLAPLSLGGFEVTARGEPGGVTTAPHMQRGDSRRHLVVVFRTLAPIYCGLTASLWVLLMLTGGQPTEAAIHAMSVMSTSGISSVGGVENGSSGLGGEMIMFLFMFFALSRLTFSTDTLSAETRRLDHDPEFRMGILLVVAVPLMLFFRHWVAALEVSSSDEFGFALRSLWGGVFTVMSFLSTTGFESAHWQTAQDWSGLETPGMILMGMAMIGGGVATTAGGVKLLRVFALYLNGVRELERLVHPSSISSERKSTKRLQRNGAYVAWVFFMLFALSLAVISTALSAFGSNFEEALILSVATLSTTGPLTEIAGSSPIVLEHLSNPEKLILCVAMVLGRMETLAFIALLSPNLWRS